MNFNSSKEILVVRENLVKAIAKYKEAICVCKQEKRVKRFKAKNYFNDQMEKYKAIVSDYEEQLKECEQSLIINSTFPTAILIEFLKSCISIKENTDYLCSSVVFTQTIYCCDHYNAQFTFNYLIFDGIYENEEKSLENSFLARHLEYFYRELLKNSEYIIAPYGETESLLTENGLNKYFRAFPYLEEIALELVDRRLAEPEKDLQLILDEELESIKNVCVKSKTNVN